MATSYAIVDVTDPASLEAGVKWWEELTGRGGEGMVVKPLDFIARGLSTKRSLALREFALGIEALERFVRREPLRRVYKSVLSVFHKPNRREQPASISIHRRHPPPET